MVFVERTFPRGGEVKHRKVSEVTSKQQFGVISRKKVIKKNKKKNDKKKNVSGVAQEESLESRKAELITAKTVTEGMLLMGYVKSIHATDLLISMPGRLQGKVPINCVSSPYTDCLEKMVQGERQPCKTLSDMFQPGDEVYVKVMGFTVHESKGDIKRINLSLNPKDLHSDLHHTKLEEGLVMCGAIESIEDHGYIVDLGVAHVRAFLSTKDDKQTQEKYAIGELVFCSLNKISSTAAVTTVQLKECPRKRVLTAEGDTMLDYILPTLTVKFIIVDVVKDGLMGKIFDGTYTAYINQMHLGHGKVIKDFEIGTEIEAKILYVMPLTKFVYLTLNTFTASDKRLPFGKILENVEILGRSQGGILIKLNSKAKGLITYAHMRMGINANVDEDVLSKKYKQDKLPVVRVMDYNPIDDVYICTDKANLIKEKYFSLADTKIGDFIQAEITKKVPGKGVRISFGQLNGFISKSHMSKAVSGQNVGSKIRGRILYIDDQYKSVVVTTHREYLKENAAILIDRDNIKIGQAYIGMIHEVTAKKILIQFFSRILGAVVKGTDVVNRSFYDSMKPGQIVRVTVTSVSARYINLTFVRDTSEDSLKLGNVFRGKIMGSYSSGMEVEVMSSKANIWISNHYVSEIPEICPQLSLAHDTEDVRFVRLSDDIYSLRDVDYFNKHKMSSWKTLMSGMVLRGFIKTVNEDSLEVHLPLKDITKTVKIFYPMVLKDYQKSDQPDLFQPEQIIYVKVLSKEPNTKIVTCSAILSQVWNGHIGISTTILMNYFKDINKIYTKLNPRLKTSDKVTVEVEEVGEEFVNVKVDGANETGIIYKDLLEDVPSVGDKLKCIVLWVSPEGIIYLSSKTNHQEMRENKDHPQFTQIKQKGKILLKTSQFFLVLLETNHVVYVPLRLHYNDFRPFLADRTGECEVILLNDRGERVIAMFRDIVEECRRVSRDVSKRRQESISESDREDSSPEKRIKIEDKEVDSVDEEMDIDRQEAAPLPGLSSNFWNTDFSWLPGAVKDESDGTSEASDSETPAKKKKLTARERLEHAKMQEARIRDREESLADGISDPQNTDDFERLVLTTPNNSFIWIKYMVYYLQATEVEKARGVARRAIKSISYREQDELINIWVALLNLELRFGTRDSFESILSESLEVNDQFKIMMRTIEMLADVRKIEELRAKASICVKKFKTNAEMWPKLGGAYFKVGLTNEAKQMMHRAIAALPQKDHIFIISNFAKLHNKFGEKETGHALLEQIVTSYPKRVDIWSMYVDMLIKDSRLDLARQILDRAILQKLPLKKMRTIFKKYQEFEEKHGDEQSVEKIKNMAEEFVQNYIKT